MGEIEVVFYGGEESKEILFKLETNELFGTHVAHCFGSGGVVLVPSVEDDGAQEVYPTSICCG